ncbi:hypothetical protein F5883DRAFT_583347 [Diaporthe sp. PMI_573]|nr:hypothetical protein F5883DRAFT_583347 [Diaporthaceae sp. PMI_573]
MPSTTTRSNSRISIRAQTSAIRRLIVPGLPLRRVGIVLVIMVNGIYIGAEISLPPPCTSRYRRMDYVSASSRNQLGTLMLTLKCQTQHIKTTSHLPSQGAGLRTVLRKCCCSRTAPQEPIRPLLLMKREQMTVFPIALCLGSLHMYMLTFCPLLQSASLQEAESAACQRLRGKARLPSSRTARDCV